MLATATDSEMVSRVMLKAHCSERGLTVPLMAIGWVCPLSVMEMAPDLEMSWSVLAMVADLEKVSRAMTTEYYSETGWTVPLTATD